MTGVSDAEIPPPQAPDLAGLPRSRLEGMLRSGEGVLECYRVLGKVSLNIVGELLKGQGTFYEYDHYPKGDVYDDERCSQYYYHAHRGEHGEHGHFHTFLRAGAIPPDVQPVPYDGAESWPVGSDAVSHLIAISMDPRGFPIEMFATNRWVTAEAWYRADDVIRMVDRFCIDHAYPSWPTNRWITGMMQLFQPQIAALLHHRDQAVEAWRRSHPDVDVYEDRKLEITGSFAIAVDEQLTAVRAALG